MVFSQAEENFAVNRGLQALPTNEITKLKLEGNIVLNDFVFNTIDEFGVVWVVTDISDWWNSPQAVVEDISRSGGDGNYDVRGRYGARQLTIEGVFLTSDPALVEAARDRLIEACDLVYKGAWLKTGTNPVRASFVYMVGQVRTNTVNTRGKTEFSIELRASDPIKYEWNDADPDGFKFVEIPVKNPSIGSSGTREIINNGNYNVPCYFEATGPFEGPGTIFNKTTGQLIILTQGLRGTIARVIINKELNFDLPNLVDIATLTTTQKHGFTPGDFIFIDGVGPEFDGDQVIKSVPTDTTFTYETSAANILPVTFKQITQDPLSPSQYLATLDTIEPHNFSVGDQIIVDGVDRAFDGTVTVSGVPSPTKIVYSRNRTISRNISSSTLVSNIATISTVDPHQFIVGEQVTVSGVDINYNGTHEIVAIPDDNSFSYAVSRTNSRVVTNRSMSDDNVTLTTSGAHGFIVNEGVNVTNVNLSLNGGYLIDAVTANTFRYRRPRLTERTIRTTAAIDGVVTITTTAEHGYSVEEGVRISQLPGLLNSAGVETTSNFLNGNRTITTIPSNVTFTFPQPSQFTVTNRSRTSNVVTLTGTSSYPFAVGDSIFVSGVATGFNGRFTITAVNLAGTTISYVSSGANVANTASSGSVFVNLVPTNVAAGRVRVRVRKVATIERIGQKLEITTETSHGAIFGENITISGAGTNLNGPYVVSGIPFLNVLEVASSGANIPVDTPKTVVKARRTSGGVVRLTTSSQEPAHGYQITSTSGHKIKVSGIGSDFDGTFDITAVGTRTIDYVQSGQPNVAEFETDGQIVKDYGFVTMSGTITTGAVTPEGQARVAGTLPFKAASGTASVSPTIARQQSGGNAIRKNNVQFTPGLSGATGIIDSDVLEIDTKNKEVAFNGEVEGARGRIDVLADFIQLAPGLNEIEFGDTGNPEGSALLRVFYRSGWLA
jgi:hypothetical protein